MTLKSDPEWPEYDLGERLALRWCVAFLMAAYAESTSSEPQVAIREAFALLQTVAGQSDHLLPTTTPNPAVADAAQRAMASTHRTLAGLEADALWHLSMRGRLRPEQD